MIERIANFLVAIRISSPDGLDFGAAQRTGGVFRRLQMMTHTSSTKVVVAGGR